MKLKLHFTTLIIWFICLSASPIIHAQITDLTSDIEVLQDTIAEQPKAIPLINIVREIEATNSNLKLTSRKINRSPDIQKIDSLLPIYAKFLKTEGDLVEHFMQANPNIQKINSATVKWNGYLNYLNQWMDRINDQEERNAILIEGIIFKDKVWKLSYANAVEQEAPKEVLSAIKQTMDDVENTKNIILKNNNYYIRLETRISTQTNYVEGIIEDLIALKNSEVYDLFHLRHPPIWKTSFKKTKKEIKEKEQVQALDGRGVGLYKLADNQKGNIIFFLIFVGLIFTTLRYFKRGFLKYPYDDSRNDSEPVIVAKNLILNQNTLSIIFLSLFFAKFFFSNLPKLLGDIITFSAIVVSIPIIMPIMSKRFKNILYCVPLFYILNSAKTYIWFSSLSYRLYILVEAAVVIIILYYFTRPFLKTIKQFTSGFNWLLIRLTPAIYVLSIISIVSNILGYTNLTDITLKISTQSGIITIIFYCLAIVINGIALSIIHRHFTVKTSYNAFERTKTENRVLKIVRITMYFLWGFFFLAMIDFLRPLLLYLSDTFTEPYKIGNLTFTIGAVLSFIITLIISFALTRLVSFLINDDDGVLRFFRLPKGIPAAVSLVIRYFIIGFGIILALSALGVDLSKFNLMAGALGLGIGFGLQNIVSNFISGLILVFERPILPGDTVEVNNLLGTVNHIGVRASNISTFDGAEVVVPNNNLISNDLINWTLSNNTKRVEILIGTTYDSDPNEILKILTEVATECQYTLKEPKPVALFNDFGDSSLNFRLLFWVHYEVGLQSKSDVSIAIYNRFKAEGIEIPFPQRDLNIKNVPENFELPVQASSVKPNEEVISKNTEKPLIEPLDTDINSEGPSTETPNESPVK